MNGLSDNEAQFHTIKNIYARTNIIALKQKPEINNATIINFQILLERKTCQSVRTIIQTVF